MRTILFALTLCVMWGTPAQEFEGLKAQDGWEREEAASPVGVTRRFDLVRCLRDRDGVQATKENWETKSYERTFPALVDKTVKELTRTISSFMRKEWRPTEKEVRDGLSLLPARLQDFWKEGGPGGRGELVYCKEGLPLGHDSPVVRHYTGLPDRIYCTYRTHGREIVIMIIGEFDASFGLSVSLSPEERDLVTKEELSDMEECANRLLHSIFFEDPYAPYRVDLKSSDGSGMIEVRGKQALSDSADIPDRDENPAHYRSALAGIIDDTKLAVVLPRGRFYFDPKNQKRIVRVPAATGRVSADHFFDVLLGKYFYHHAQPPE